MNAEILAIFIAGLVASPFIQFLKEKANVSGRAALWMTWILCILIALFAQIATGELGLGMAISDPAVFFTELGLAFSAVLGLATIVFKLKFSPPGE